MRQPVTASPALVINLIKPLFRDYYNKQFSQDFSHDVSHFSIFSVTLRLIACQKSILSTWQMFAKLILPGFRRVVFSARQKTIFAGTVFSMEKAGFFHEPAKTCQP
jgi:hypothetical protein